MAVIKTLFAISISDGSYNLAFTQIPRKLSELSLTLPHELIGAKLIEALETPNSIVKTYEDIEDF